MSTYTELLPSTKSEKNAAFTFTPATTDNTPRAGILAISGKRSHAVYAVDELPADEGRGFMLLKRTPGSDVTEDHYAVFITPGGVNGHYECKGFTAHRHCKHLTSILELVKANRI